MNNDVLSALEAIEVQLHEMRSLKGWRLNLIRENLARAKAALSGVAQAPTSAEAIARTICLSYGRDPDAMTSIGEMCDADNGPVPIWMVYEEQADAILVAYSVSSTPLCTPENK